MTYALESEELRILGLSEAEAEQELALCAAFGQAAARLVGGELDLPIEDRDRGLL